MTTEDKKRKSDITAEQAKVSRRSFIKGTAIAGAGAAAILQSENSEAQDSN
ncbi:MAG TPA: twin-arginine translocation signal domain-containing protein, partial [Porticoccaceae bacterium]|nr:twin-arginine translocation signal domain-containing protein [Porticoccaceae bacterium]